MRVIPESVWKLWNGLEIRMLVLLSLTLQILLVSVAPLRKCITNKFLSFVLWAFYLGADYVATLALGNLLSKQTQNSEEGINGGLVVLWAPFLLLHLGGPDAITSYSLEDNELWLRHLLGLVFQVSAAVLAFVSSLPNPGLWQPAIAVFISGFWKYVERTLSLRAASMDVLRESMITKTRFPNYVKFMQEYASSNEAGLEAKIVIENEPEPQQQHCERKDRENIGDPNEAIIKAHKLFNTFKRLAVDLMLSFQDRNDSQSFFFKSEAAQAFRVVEIELSFLYDILYTKFGRVNCVACVVMRFFTLCVTLSAPLLFHHCTRHHSFKKTDIVATYVLFVAAVILEVISIGMLLRSDWMVVALEKRKSDKCAQLIFHVVNCCRTRFIFHVVNCCCRSGNKRWSNSMRQYNLNSCRRSGNKRWSNSMRQYNLLDFCLAERKKKVTLFQRLLKLLRLKGPWDKFRASSWFKRVLEFLLRLKKLWDNSWASRFKHVLKLLRLKEPWDNFSAFWTSWFKRVLEFLRLKKRWDNFLGNLWTFWASLFIPHKDVPEELKKLIFEELKEKAESAEGLEIDFKSLSKCRGEWVLQFKGYTTDFSWSIDNRDYEESILMWHIATEILLNVPATTAATVVADHDKGKNKTTDEDHDNDHDNNESSNNAKTKETTNGENTRDNPKMCKLISDYMVYLLVMQPAMLPRGIGKVRFQETCEEAKMLFSNKETFDLKDACTTLLEVNPNINPMTLKGEKGVSVLFEACGLAQQLTKVFKAEEKRWKLISAVWVELMCYAAGSCRTDVHAKQLPLGGELLTHVWLMMAHMGIGEQFKVGLGGRAKLLVQK